LYRAFVCLSGFRKKPSYSRQLVEDKLSIGIAYFGFWTHELDRSFHKQSAATRRLLPADSASFDVNNQNDADVMNKLMQRWQNILETW
jgi:hypothetical protein